MEVNLANILIGHHFRLHLESCHAIVKIDVETRMVIDFQDPRLQVPVNQQIEAKYLERLALQCLFTREGRHLLLDQRAINLHCLRTRVRDAVLDFLNIDSLLCKRLVKRLQRTLRAIVFD